MWQYLGDPRPKVMYVVPNEEVFKMLCNFDHFKHYRERGIQLALKMMRGGVEDITEILENAINPNAASAHLQSGLVERAGGVDPQTALSMDLQAAFQGIADSITSKMTSMHPALVANLNQCMRSIVEEMIQKLIADNITQCVSSVVEEKKQELVARMDRHMQKTQDLFKDTNHVCMNNIVAMSCNMQNMQQQMQDDSRLVRDLLVKIDKLENQLRQPGAAAAPSSSAYVDRARNSSESLFVESKKKAITAQSVDVAQLSIEDFRQLVRKGMPNESLKTREIGQRLVDRGISNVWTGLPMTSGSYMMVHLYMHHAYGVMFPAKGLYKGFTFGAGQ